MRGLRRALGAGLVLLALFPAVLRAGEGDRLDAAGLRSLVAQAGQAGAATVVNYWATWCGPCRDEIPILRAIRREFPQERLRLVGVSLDLDESAYRSFVRAHPFGYPTLYGGERLLEELGVRAIPRTEVYAANGTLLRAYEGRVDETRLREDIKALLDQGGGGRP